MKQDGIGKNTKRILVRILWCMSIFSLACIFPLLYLSHYYVAYIKRSIPRTQKICEHLYK